MLNFISQFNYIVAVPAGDVKVYEEFDGDYKTNSKRHMRDEQVKFRLLVYSKEKVRRKKKRLVYFARATNLDLPKREVLDLYNKVRSPIETSPTGNPRKTRERIKPSITREKGNNK